MDLGQGSAMALPIVGDFWKQIRNDKYFKKFTDTKFPENKTALNLVGCPFKMWRHPDSINVSNLDSLGEIIYDENMIINEPPSEGSDGTEDYEAEIESLKAAQRAEDENRKREEEEEKKKAILEEKKRDEEKKKLEEKKKAEEKKKTEENKKAQPLTPGKAPVKSGIKTDATKTPGKTSSN
jgi:hypothetical protein